LAIARDERELHFCDDRWSGCVPYRMRRWELTIALDPGRQKPLFLQLASGIADDIQRGRLKPGDSLPGSRELAECLGVNRNTVMAGYGELIAEGLLKTRIGGGTFVAEPASLPLVPSAASMPASPDLPTYALAPLLHAATRRKAPPPGMMMMWLGMPDVRLFPAQALARAFRRALGQRGSAVLSYSDPSGHERLRVELATMLARSRGLLATPDNIMVTRSIEQAIDLVARTLLTPGDVVAVEAFGYPPARSVLQLAGARLVPVPVDDDGFDVGALETLLTQQRVRAVFLTPHHQFPTTTVMSAARRERLANLALTHGFAIIEDDYDHEFHYNGKPVLPIAAGRGRANVIYIGSLANLLAPGISTGFVLAPSPVFERLLSLRAASDARSDVAVECAIAEMFQDGELLRHMRRMRRIYASRRDALATALTRHLGSAVEFRIPEGGMALWARVDDAIDVAAWAAAGEREGVMFQSARPFDFHQREQSFVRLGFSYHDETELLEAVRRMARALTRTRTSQLAAAAQDSARRAPGEPRGSDHARGEMWDIADRSSRRF
jgi:GntR family transcriptional regulator / MocR family aminotransferase